MRAILFAAAAAVATLGALPVAAATLKVTFQDNRSITVGPNNNPTNVLSPAVTLGFANATDYTTLANPSTGPLFTAADLVFVEWERIENLAAIETNPLFENPQLTQAVFDTLTYITGTNSIGQSVGLFKPVSGDMVPNTTLAFRPDATTGFQTGPMVLLNLRGQIIEPTGNWDNDVFNDALPWDFVRTQMEWDPSATSFAPSTAPSVAAVPLPAGLPLLMVGVAGLAVLRRRQKS